jgi:hypothetical protein
MPIENSMSRIAERTRDRYEVLISGAQKRANEAAGRVSRGKKPVKTLSQLGLKLTAVGHRTADKILKQNTTLVENQIDAFAERLQAAAAANDVRDLVGTQFRLIPQNASRFASDARGALGIVAGAGSEMKDLLKGTFDELRGATQAGKTSAKTSSKKTSKKVAAKATSKKAAPAKAEKRAA